MLGCARAKSFAKAFLRGQPREATILSTVVQRAVEKLRS